MSTIGLPNRYIAGVTVDPKNPAHAYAIFNGHSRRWIPGGGVGHVFETFNGQGAGTTWSRLGTGLPNASINDLTPGPDGYIYAATHGRGIWRVSF